MVPKMAVLIDRLKKYMCSGPEFGAGGGAKEGLQGARSAESHVRRKRLQPWRAREGFRERPRTEWCVGSSRHPRWSVQEWCDNFRVLTPVQTRRKRPTQQAASCRQSTPQRRAARRVGPTPLAAPERGLRDAGFDGRAGAPSSSEVRGSVSLSSCSRCVLPLQLRRSSGTMPSTPRGTFNRAPGPSTQGGGASRTMADLFKTPTQPVAPPPHVAPTPAIVDEVRACIVCVFPPPASESCSLLHRSCRNLKGWQVSRQRHVRLPSANVFAFINLDTAPAWPKSGQEGVRRLTSNKDCLPSSLPP